MPDTIAVRVAAGAEFLDAHQPGWWQNVNLDCLDLEDDCLCILGQCIARDEEDYFNACLALGLQPYAERAVGMGFNERPYSPTRDYGGLTAEWKRLIEDRRAGERDA